MKRWTRSFALVCLTLGLACGRKAEREPTAPSAEPAPESGTPAMAAPPPAPATMEGESKSFAESPADDDALARAQTDLEQAQDQLELALGSPPSQSAPTGAGAPAPAAASPKRSRDAESSSKDEAAKPDKKGGETSCQTACRAFQSLGRAASSICRLAGTEDGRCSHARSVVAQAERRVSSCGCKSD